MTIEMSPLRIDQIQPFLIKNVKMLKLNLMSYVLSFVFCACHWLKVPHYAHFSEIFRDYEIYHHALTFLPRHPV